MSNFVLDYYLFDQSSGEIPEKTVEELRLHKNFLRPRDPFFKCDLKEDCWNLIERLRYVYDISTRDVVYAENPNEIEVPTGYFHRYDYILGVFEATTHKLTITPYSTKEVSLTEYGCEEVDYARGDACPICLVDFEETDEKKPEKMLQNKCCKKRFCHGCFDQYIASKTMKHYHINCPCCRKINIKYGEIDRVKFSFPVFSNLSGDVQNIRYINRVWAYYLLFQHFRHDVLNISHNPGPHVKYGLTVFVESSTTTQNFSQFGISTGSSHTTPTMYTNLVIHGYFLKLISFFFFYWLANIVLCFSLPKIA
jgi:hypothetical protein